VAHAPREHLRAHREHGDILRIKIIRTASRLAH
jgi:hypothetical protein